MKARQILEKHPMILAAYLHGSTAKGTARQDSDIDIALLPEPGHRLPLRQRLEYAAELEAQLGAAVDVGELSSGNVVYAKEVVAHGREIFTRNRFKSDLFMATSLAMYAELQQQRKEVLDAYTA
ncbi:hypothetical protein PDESU_02277 [Pontiella desulfatans]|uniref:Polymerase beta nucleotidyltransferase domain-containing protein n=1 Tax=Pontiella desulfatans TaxID=2750659 RepID=A0A6C2U167_PONDE|nr:nucleotidyltransferase domain-containing protein [Pontiella desulfatans]VGO13720.1 hypothetical protein PDESU_02277 [Pontiella desulfatans]